MFSNGVFHIVNIAGGLNLDPRLWQQHLRSGDSLERISHRSEPLESLSDAAEQLRRLARYTAPKGVPAKLLASALEIVERENLAAQRKSRSIATSGLSAGGIG